MHRVKLSFDPADHVKIFQFQTSIISWPPGSMRIKSSNKHLMFQWQHLLRASQQESSHNLLFPDYSSWWVLAGIHPHDNRDKRRIKLSSTTFLGFIWLFPTIPPMLQHNFLVYDLCALKLLLFALQQVTRARHEFHSRNMRMNIWSVVASAQGHFYLV